MPMPHCAKSAGQFIENIVVKGDTLASARTFDIFEEIDSGVVRSTHPVVPDSRHDIFKLLFQPGSVARVGDRSDFFDKIPEAVDLDGCSLADGFQDRVILSSGT